MYPHERSLVARMKDRPFALIGVNSDKDKSDLKKAMRAQGITWRSFWNGPQGTRGPLSSMYGVHGWPTIYVLDHQGVIRFKNVRGAAMDKAVDQLIEYAEKAQLADASKYPIVGKMAPVFRKWVDTTGKFSIDAEFVQFRDGQAHLKKKDGGVIQVAMTKLSKRDQEFIRRELRSRKR